MILASNQPYFLPYFPYWQLIHAADRFLLGDDFAFIRRGWINRNRIRMGGQDIWFRVELRKASSFKLIRDTFLKEPVSVSGKLRTLETAYHSAPFFQDGYALAERIFACPESNLALFLEASIREVCAYLDIDTPIGRTSSLEGNAALKRERRIYDMCHRLGATHYINPIGGQALYSFEEFRRQGIRLSFLSGQASGAGNLSVLDAIMNHSRDELHAMLDQYTFIDG